MKIDFFETVHNLKDCLQISEFELSNLLEVSLKTIKKREDRTKEPRGDFKIKIINLCKENNIQLVKYHPDFEFIKRICNLTCTDLDLLKNVKFIKYDYDHPFEKYYSLEIITKAYNKLIDKSWSIEKFTYWIVFYYHIINGGFYEELVENFITLENFVINYLTYLFDGFSFICSYEEIKDWEILYTNIKNLDHILKTISSWRCVCTLKNEKNKLRFTSYFMLINDNLKEYIVFIGDISFSCAINNDLIKSVDANSFVEQFNTLVANNYRLLSLEEEYLLCENAFRDINLTFLRKDY